VSEVRITAEIRTDFGKGGARRTRRDGKIPAVLYGHGQAPRHIALPSRDFTRAMKHGMNTLFSIEVDGAAELALPKALQRDPLKDTIDHVDLLLVRRGEKVTVELPIVITGEVARGGLINHEASTVTVEAEATHLPESVEVSIDGLEIGHHVHAKDLALPRGTTLISDPDLSIVGILQAPTAAQVEAELAEAQAELGIEKPSEEESAEAAPAEAAEKSE
jgi:large subunit ribosomal protein L25